MLAAVSLLAAIAAAALASFYADLTRDLPSAVRIEQMMDPVNGMLASPTKFTDRSAQEVLAVLGSPGGERQYLSIVSSQETEIPSTLIAATIAAEDPDFWQHPGFHLASLLDTGPDGIPVKLVSDLLFWDEDPGLKRSLREKLLAAQVVSTYGREQVLEWYLNSAHYGHMAFGAEAAARLYFGKSVSRLSMGQAATLAAAAQAPDLNPLDTPALARSRRDAVLERMVDAGSIPADEAAAAMEEPLVVRPVAVAGADAISAFEQIVLDQLDPLIPIEVLARGGLRVVTSLDIDLQTELACTLGVQLGRLSASGPVEVDNCEAARLLPSLAGSALPGAGIRGEVVAVDPGSGKVLALVSTASDAGWLPSAGTHAPGSILTPYVYLAAFTRGFGPASLVWDIPAYLSPGLAGSPNADGDFHGPARMRIALAGDYLVPSLQLLNQFGESEVWAAAALTGLSSLDDQPEDLLLGGGSLSLLEIVHAYSAINTQGVLIGYPDSTSAIDPVPLKPTAVLRVEDKDGRVWLELGPPQARPVMSAPLAYALTHVLSDEPARWPALGHPNVLEIGRPAGVKMGFTQDRQDAWAVGFTPQIVVGVWLGYEGGGGGGAIEAGAAAGVWHAAMKYALRDTSVEGWSAPQGIGELEVCDPSGLLPTPECPVIVREIFLPGSEPSHTDTLYRSFEINRETGLLATIFTPQSLIEERIFLVPPPEALAWAQQAGLDIPPENYDLVSRPPPASEEVRITSPQMFAYLGGEIEILGTAAGDGFQSFSVQVGQGLNPQQWLQLGDVSKTPVRDGRLAVWDAGDLGGLYALRLLVVRQDNRIETHIIQVTLDNVPPQVEILYPTSGQPFQYPQESTITIQLSASDDLFLDRLEIYLDDHLVETLSTPPFAAPLVLLPGEHRLRVVGYDLAGNTTEVETEFQVER